MDTVEPLPTLIAAAAASPGPEHLVCPCGGSVVLAGLPAPTYTCQGCGAVRHALAELVVRMDIDPTLRMARRLLKRWEETLASLPADSPKRAKALAEKTNVGKLIAKLDGRTTGAPS
jgi:hypothetical protein